MMMVDTRNRWVYKGSVTTPPCATIVYWNVVRKVYPLKQAHLDLFKAQMKRATDLETNYREIQTYDLHDLHIIRAEGGRGGFDITIILIVLVVLFLVVAAIQTFRVRKAMK